MAMDANMSERKGLGRGKSRARWQQRRMGGRGGQGVRGGKRGWMSGKGGQGGRGGRSGKGGKGGQRSWGPIIKNYFYS
ncbi:hypothetical protein RF55_15696 [Lasius niger]|uniref:Uncharacterized protein n=1 Tax=Lasius niger TaxID=67767 RepID=A0A0J7MYV7_LASNI|nr:hypothetical protein RF55_15696 [Lasius niger]